MRALEGPVLTMMVRSGLGNRIRVLCGGLALARKWGLEKVDVSWPTGRDFEPELEDLWSFPVRRVGSATVALRRALGRSYDAEIAHLAEPPGRFTTLKTQHALSLPPGCADWGQLLREATPHEKIRERTTSVWEAGELGTAPYVGVMIRSGSKAHPKTVQASPTDWYLDFCARVRKETHIDRFFLSTDSPEAEEVFSRTFPGTVTVAPKGRYNSVEGVRDAITDLYLLASSAMIVGPYWSSFVTMAEKLAPQVPSYNSMSDDGKINLQSSIDVARDPLSPWAR